MLGNFSWDFFYFTFYWSFLFTKAISRRNILFFLRWFFFILNFFTSRIQILFPIVSLRWCLCPSSKYHALYHFEYYLPVGITTCRAVRYISTHIAHTCRKCDVVALVHITDNHRRERKGRKEAEHLRSTIEERTRG